MSFAPTSSQMYEISNISASAILLATFIWQSIRRRQVTPFLAVSLGVLSIFWMEAPFDWALGCQFPPDLARFPPWGPLGMTPGGLIVMAPICYIMFFSIPVALSVLIARKVSAMRQPPVGTLLTVAFIVGFVWDVPNQLLGIHAGWWRYGHGLAGVTINPGTLYTYTFGEAVFMTTFLTICTYLGGRVDSQGRTLMHLWAERVTSSTTGRAIATIAATIVIMNAVYVLLFIPFMIVKLNNLFTVVYDGLLYQGLPREAEHPADPSKGWIGTTIVFAWTSMVLLGFVLLVLSKDRTTPSRASDLAPATNQT
jgi:hypothetical protein